jgi:hypothetical protein
MKRQRTRKRHQARKDIKKINPDKKRSQQQQKQQKMQRI